jgi:prevent-host-death family protein
MQTWQMQEAKAQLSAVVRDAERTGPQQITVHGRPVAVVLSRADYDRLAVTGESLVAFVRRSPLAGLEAFDIERDRSLTREPAL